MEEMLDWINLISDLFFIRAIRIVLHVNLTQKVLQLDLEAILVGR